jgi:hypothetical protein
MTRDNGIHQEIGQTADLSQAELIASWRKLIMSPRSKGIRRVLLERASVFRIHMWANGDVTSTARKRLLAIAEPGDIAKPILPERCDVPGDVGQHHNCPDLDPGHLTRSNVEYGLQRARIDTAGK